MMKMGIIEMRTLFCLSVCLLLAAKVQADPRETTCSFADLSVHDSLDNTLNVDDDTNGITVGRTVVGDGYKYMVTYANQDFDGDATNDTLAFAFKVSAVTGSVADHYLIASSATTNGAVASIGSIDAQVDISTDEFTVGGNMGDGETLVFTLLGAYSSVGTAQFNGFDGLSFKENASSYGHGYVVGEGRGLFGETWNNNGSRSIAPINTLIVTADQNGGSNHYPEKWGVQNVSFGFTVTVSGEPEVAEDFYVSTTGDDANPGTLAEPFATVQHALYGMGPGDTCYIRGGTYREAVDLSWIAGAEGNPITLTPFGDEEVKFDGTVAITNSWTLDEGNIYKTTLTEDITQLFVGEKLMTLARFPNAPAFSDQMWSYASHRRRVASSSRFEVVDNPNAGASATLEGAGFSFNDCVAVCNFADHVTYARLVKDHVAGSNTFNVAWMEKIGTSNYYFMEGGKDNAERAMLDMAGEWAYDESFKTLYLWSEDGQNPTGRAIYGKTQECAFVGNAYTRHIVIDGLDFWATTVAFASSDDITIQNCDFDYYVASKRALGDISASVTASFIGEESDFCQDITVYNCAFRYADGAGLVGKYVENMLIENNLFSEIDYANIDVFAAVQMNNAQDLVYRRNTMKTAGAGQGMSANRYKTGPIRPVTIEYNFHTDCARKQGDGSSIYMPHDDVVESVARYNWFIGNYERDFRWDGWNDPLLGTNANFYCNVAMSTLIKAVAVGDGCHLKGDNHEVYNNTGIGKWSSVEVSIGKGGNAHSTSRNNAADLLDDYLEQASNPDYFTSEAWFSTTNSTYHRNENDWGLPGDDSNNVAAQKESFKMSSQLRDADNWDFRPRATATALIDQGTNVTCTVNGVAFDVTAGFLGDAPDIGAYEFGKDSYWIPGRQEAQASMPVPKNAAVAVPIDADLMYLIGLGGARAHIYVGSSPDQLEFAATRKDPQNIVEFAEAPGLEPNQTYYWRVDTELADGSVETGEVWSFDTVGMIPMSSRTVAKSAYWDPVTDDYGTVTSWIYDSVGTSYDRSAILYSTSSYQSAGGFRLTVYYTIGLLDDGGANNFSFGLVSDETELTGFASNPFKGQTDVYSLGANLTTHGGTEKQGLNFTDGTACTNLDQSGDNVQFATKKSTRVDIEIRQGGVWSYSINGTVEASGTIAEGFDLTKRYRVVVYGQDDNGNGKSIQDVALELLKYDSYPSWAAGYGLTGDNAQFGTDAENGGAGDGYDNLAEYALGMNPTRADAGSKEFFAPVVEGGTNYFEFVHNRRTDHAEQGLTYLLIDTTNLVDSVACTNMQDQIFVGPAVDGYETVTNRYADEGLAKFFRLRIRQE
ncbi:hypothetical protein [Pontiella sp.]|uniref:hypothetical protein n=1 Tax=Pontiella sp. TaxID=2837462 RepID=UPI003567D566